MKKKLLIGLGLSSLAVFGAALSLNASSNLKKVSFKYDGTVDETVEATGVAYYSDDYFKVDSDIYNESLSTLSFCVTMTSASAISTDDYALKSRNIQNFYSDMGFNNVEVNQDYLEKPTRDSIGLCLASKEIDGSTLIALGIRSGGYGAEWASNFTVGDGSDINYHHEGFYNAASEAISFISDYIYENSIEGDIKLWVSGYSRGAATANLIAGRLDTDIKNGVDTFGSKVNLDFNDLYAYTFETPQGASYNSVGIDPRGSEYDNIFNIINPNDIVPRVPFSEFGFTRYGNDLFINTEFTNPDDYASKLSVFENNYYSLVEGIDEYTVDTVEASQMDGDRDYTKVNYSLMEVEANMIYEIAEQFESRENYVENYQEAITDAMEMFFNLDSDEIKPTLTQFFKSMFTGWLQDIGLMDEDSETVASNNQIIKAAGSKLIPVLYNIWTDYHSSELYTLIHNIESIGQAHMHPVCYSWLMCMDKNYTNNTIDVLNDNYSYYHLKFYAYNDLVLKDNNTGEKYIEIDGHYFDESDVYVNKLGYSAGYYFSLTNANMELFIPTTNSYKLTYDGAVKSTHKNASVALYKFDGEVGCDTYISKTTSKLTIFSAAKNLYF